MAYMQAPLTQYVTGNTTGSQPCCLATLPYMQQGWVMGQTLVTRRVTGRVTLVASRQDSMASNSGLQAVGNPAQPHAPGGNCTASSILLQRQLLRLAGHIRCCSLHASRPHNDAPSARCQLLDSQAPHCTTCSTL